MTRRAHPGTAALRGAALMPAAALAVHQLRYALAFGDGAPRALAAQARPCGSSSAPARGGGCRAAPGARAVRHLAGTACARGRRSRPTAARARHAPRLALSRGIDHDDALELTNRSGRTVVVSGYDGEAYVRVLADGTVQVDEHSPTSATPHWVALDETGRYAWHDDRIKWRKTAVAPQVTDTSKETKVFDWRVPIHVGTQTGTIAGTLFWVGEPGSSGGFPVAAIVSLVVLALLAAGAVVLVRRRRQGVGR